MHSFQFALIVLLISPISVEIVKKLSIGETLMVECSTGMIPKTITAAEGNAKFDNGLIWMKDKRNIIPKDCSKCKVWYGEKIDGNSLLTITPFTKNDFGNYSCHNFYSSLGMEKIDEITVIEVSRNDLTKCKKDQILSSDPSLMYAYTPFCDENGQFKEIQAKTLDNQTVYWCVDKITGNKVSDKNEPKIKNLPCLVRTGLTSNLSLIILLLVQFALVVVDVTLCFTCKQGVVAYLYYDEHS